MKSNSAKKGRALEKAVSLIQNEILKSNPELNGVKYSIECNKRVCVANVWHEVDVWVKTSPGSQFEASFIFECKNWKKTVGKNEVMNLGRKAELLGATRGYLVARRFSSDAVAQSTIESRITLVECSDDFVTPFSLALVHMIHDPIHRSVSIKESEVFQNNPPVTFDLKGKTCIFRGQHVDFFDFIEPYFHDTIIRYEAENPALFCHQANHFAMCSGQTFFEPGELTIGETEVEYVITHMKLFVNFYPQKLVSKFELKGQGRVFSFESPDETQSDTRLKIDLIQRIGILRERPNSIALHEELCNPTTDREATLAGTPGNPLRHPQNGLAFRHVLRQYWQCL